MDGIEEYLTFRGERQTYSPPGPWFSVPEVLPRGGSNPIASPSEGNDAGRRFGPGQGRSTEAFALLRPPGHHAMRIVHGSRGFGTVNNEAIMVEHIRHRLAPRNKRLPSSIQMPTMPMEHPKIFSTTTQVWLHISIHQDGRTLLSWYGGHPGAGEDLPPMDKRVNIPLPPGTGDEGPLYVMEKAAAPILQDWGPDIIINAAGQDNHFHRPADKNERQRRWLRALNRYARAGHRRPGRRIPIEGGLPYVNVGIPWLCWP